MPENVINDLVERQEK